MIRNTLLLVSLLFGSSVLTAPVSVQNAGSAPNNPVNQSTSANWSGYVADTATSYTGVGGTWVVPSPSGIAQTTLATDATWVGIGGVKSHDLIQTGTQAVIENGQVEYQAWYELLPQGQHILPLTVNGGDSVTVSLTQIASGMWHLSFKDNTTGGDYEKDITYNSSLSSAEWIEEMPATATSRFISYLPLDNFGTVSFSGGYTVADGTRQTIAGAGAMPLTMAGRGDVALATPSSLSGGSFSIARSDSPTAATGNVRQVAYAGGSGGMGFGGRGGHRSFGMGSGRHVLVYITFGQ